MTTKFNKDMYAKMRSKKDEPLSNIRKKGVRDRERSVRYFNYLCHSHSLRC